MSQPSNNQIPPLLAIVGPTAVGKTAVGIAMAKQCDGEIISADSRQVYTGMDVATGKEVQLGEWQVVNGRPTLVVDGVFIHGLNLVEPGQAFSVADWLDAVHLLIAEIQQRGHKPIIVGGTGLYVAALMGQLTNQVPPQAALRRQLEALDLTELQHRLQAVDLDRWSKLNDSDRQNPVRLIRAIEISTSKFLASRSQLPEVELFLLGLTATQEELYRRADARVLQMIDQGLIEETQRLMAQYDLTSQAMSGIGYAEVIRHLQGEISLDQAVKLIQFRTHDYIRRQNTWWRKQDVCWVNVDRLGWQSQVDKLVAESGNMA